MVTIINRLRSRNRYSTRDVRHILNNSNEDIIKEIERHLRLLDPDLYSGTVTVFESEDGTYKVKVESSDADNAKRMTNLLQPYIDSLNN